MKWTSVKDELPRQGSRVIASDGRCLFFDIEYRKLHDIDDTLGWYMNYNDGDGIQKISRITHWMHKPKLPVISPEEWFEFCECEDYYGIDRNGYCRKCGGELKEPF